MKTTFTNKIDQIKHLNFFFLSFFLFLSFYFFSRIKCIFYLTFSSKFFFDSNILELRFIFVNLLNFMSVSIFTGTRCLFIDLVNLIFRILFLKINEIKTFLTNLSYAVFLTTPFFATLISLLKSTETLFSLSTPGVFQPNQPF